MSLICHKSVPMLCEAAHYEEKSKQSPGLVWSGPSVSEHSCVVAPYLQPRTAQLIHLLCQAFLSADKYWVSHNINISPPIFTCSENLLTWVNCLVAGRTPGPGAPFLLSNHVWALEKTG